MANDRLILRPLIGLMQGKEPLEIERYTIEEIQKHRYLREQAVGLEAALVSVDGDPATERAYISAMMAVHAQHTVISTLIEILGYIPDVKSNSPGCTVK